MGYVTIEVEEIELERECSGEIRLIKSVSVRCTRCGNEAEVYGQSEASIKRGCVMLAETCPKEQRNFYGTEPPIRPPRRQPAKRAGE